MTPITIIKRDPTGQETFRYTGEILQRGPNYILLEAYFNRPDLPFHGIVLGTGDRFIETYYSDRWYNIFEIHDRQDDRLKAWYCNVGFPAEIGEDTVSYIDLALDLLVFPDGRQLALDADEFAALEIPPHIQEQGKASLRRLQEIFREKFPDRDQV
jgi:predicted RNA-binding protein associated with RNAse of E/G family